MKPKIHPQFYLDTVVTCTCGNTFITGSTKKAIKAEVCAKCHPFYTGEEKFIDAKGTVEKFLKREKEAKSYKVKVAAKKDKNKDNSDKKSQSLKELLGGIS